MQPKHPLKTQPGLNPRGGKNIQCWLGVIVVLFFTVSYTMLLPRQYMMTPASLSMVRKSSKPIPVGASTSPGPASASELNATALHEQPAQREHAIKGEDKDEPARTEPQRGGPQGQQQEAATVANKDEGAKKTAETPVAPKTPFQQALEEVQNSQRGTGPVYAAILRI